MESIELYHAERISLPLKLASWNDLRFSHKMVPIEGLPRTSESIFHPDRGLLWIEGADLFTSTPMWLPYEMVHTNYTLPLPAGSGCFVLSSNGLASGNHTLEAISHGLCELIERDATTLFWLRSREARDASRIDLSTVLDAECRRLLELYERAGVAVGVWDVTSDVGIAAFYCAVVDREPAPFRPIGPMEGMGCHLVREVALLRALTEAAQARLTVIVGSRDDNGRRQYMEAQGDELMQRARAQLLREGSRSFEATPTQVNDTLEDDVAALLRGLRGAGLSNALVIDLTKAGLNIPVVRVIIPGLETYHHIQSCLPGERARRVLEASAKGRA